MPRTTVDIDAPVLRELERRSRKEGKSLGRLISELLAVALEAEARTEDKPFRWYSQAMVPRVDFEDKGPLNEILDG
ncbi:MAG TPA: antitoxin [Actinomycetota bacterium]|nr:antitoxin [Actinomycetota bacterium]